MRITLYVHRTLKTRPSRSMCISRVRLALSVCVSLCVFLAPYVTCMNESWPREERATAQEALTTALKDKSATLRENEVCRSSVLQCVVVWLGSSVLRISLRRCGRRRCAMVSVCYSSNTMQTYNAKIHVRLIRLLLFIKYHGVPRSPKNDMHKNEALTRIRYLMSEASQADPSASIHQIPNASESLVLVHVLLVRTWCAVVFDEWKHTENHPVCIRPLSIFSQNLYCKFRVFSPGAFTAAPMPRGFSHDSLKWEELLLV